MYTYNNYNLYRVDKKRLEILGLGAQLWRPRDFPLQYFIHRIHVI